MMAPARAARERGGDQSSRPPATLFLTREMCEAFDMEGHLVIRSITTPEEIAAIRDVYDRLFASRAGWETGDWFDFVGEDVGAAAFPQMLDLSRYAPSLRDTRLWANAEAAAKQLLGPEAQSIFEHGLCKPALNGPSTPWHQDQAFVLAGSRHISISFWVPLQPVTVESGCMQFVPRSHLGPLYSHRPLNGNLRIHALEALGADVSGAVACPLNVGDATVHHRMTLHGAGPNLTSESRRAYTVGFGIRTSKPVLDQDYPWNRIRRTAREARHSASLGRLERMKQRMKRGANAILLAARSR